MDKEVILVSGDNSDWFLEAVFVVKDKKSLPKNLIVEAEKIIEGYLYNKGLSVPITEDAKIYRKSEMETLNRQYPQKRRNKGYSFLERLFLYSSLITLCVLMGFLLRGVL